MTLLDEIKRSVIKVGEGRGFVVSQKGAVDRLIVTAGHCLPFVPPCVSFSFVEERTYPSLVGLPGAERTIWTECFFVDRVADIALLGPPDSQNLSDEFEQYNTVINGIAPLSISDAPLNGTACLLSLDGRWVRCKIQRFRPTAPLWISDAENIAGGMSGSPIILEDGSAIGVVTAGSHRGGGPEVVRKVARNQC